MIDHLCQEKRAAVGEERGRRGRRRRRRLPFVYIHSTYVYGVYIYVDGAQVFKSFVVVLPCRMIHVSCNIYIGGFVTCCMLRVPKNGDTTKCGVAAYNLNNFVMI